MYATEKQISYLLSLASQIAGRPLRYIGEAEPFVPVSKTALRRLTRRDASICIDHLKAQVG